MDKSNSQPRQGDGVKRSRPESAKANAREIGPPGILGTGVGQSRAAGKGGEANFLQFGGGYKIRVNAGSGYRAFLSVMASRGSFEECTAILGSRDFDPGNKGQAAALLSKMMVPMSEVEDLVRKDQSWISHQQRRTDRLGAAPVLGASRVKDGKWHGNVREIATTCLGSYNPEVRNRNVRNFREAGVAFRMFPLRPRKLCEAQALLMPSEYAHKVKAAIKTVYGVEE